MIALPATLRNWWITGAVTMACLGCLSYGEWYPFSHFPMYSKNRDEAFVLYVTDENDRLLPTREHFQRTGSTVKKHHDAILKKMKSEGRIKRIDEAGPNEDKEVAAEVLSRLQAAASARPWQKLRLYRKTWSLEQGTLNYQTILLGEQ